MNETFLEYKMRVASLWARYRTDTSGLMMFMVDDARPPVSATVRNLSFRMTPRIILLIISHMMQSFEKLNHDFGYEDVPGFAEVHAAFNKLFEVTPQDHRRIE